jgi:acyl dehydratase
MHIDIDVARSSSLDDVFGHGMLSMAYLGRVLTDWAPPEKLRSYSVRFAAITPVLAEPLAEGTVTAIEVVDDEQRATIDVTVTLSDGSVTLSGTAVVAL